MTPNISNVVIVSLDANDASEPIAAGIVSRVAERASEDGSYLINVTAFPDGQSDGRHIEAIALYPTKDEALDARGSRVMVAWWPEPAAEPKRATADGKGPVKSK